MKPYEKFLEHSSLLREILDLYLELRLHIQELGFSEEELEKVTNPSARMMSMHGKIQNKKKALFQQVKDYGFDITLSELNGYIIPLFEKINEITPLSHGNHKRGNQGNEDY
jgi:hypothetical protein